MLSPFGFSRAFLVDLEEAATLGDDAFLGNRVVVGTTSAFPDGGDYDLPQVVCRNFENTYERQEDGVPRGDGDDDDVSDSDSDSSTSSSSNSSSSPSASGFDSSDVPTRPLSVQFLNMEGTAAVRLRTNPFNCGAVPQPVTLFCVSVSMEDGCFLSGLRGRFELGHRYPDSDVASVINMSPFMLTASTIFPSPPRRGKGGGYTSDSSGVDDASMSEDSDDDDDDDDEDNDDEPPPDEDIKRGITPPGRWHVYTAVFDGERSVLRVDGVPETSREEERGGGRQRGVGSGSLDGLTLGGDHMFDSPICSGSGTDGEGDGSIAEVVAFSGVLAQSDLESVERYLLAKHRIGKGSKGRKVGDVHRRDAHALIAQAPPWNLDEFRVPLKYAAQERSMSWNRFSEVTRESFNIARIGASKKSEESSDW